MTNWLQRPAQSIDTDAIAAATKHQTQLTKPAGALGQLEAIAIRLAGMQGQTCPTLDEVAVTVFAADHGVAAQGVSAYPQAVTAQMILNFLGGGAAISVLAGETGAHLEIVNLGTVDPVPAHPELIDAVIAPQTADLSVAPAMTDTQLSTALAAGRAAIERASSAQLFIGGDMGIANTTSATALACALLNKPAAAIAGPGTGLDAAGIEHKCAIIDQALALHLPACHSAVDTALETLRRLGGFEIAALCGAYIAAAQAGIAILVDGFITTAAALVASRIHPGIRDWLIFAHRSAEPGHQAMLNTMQADPLLDLGMRLGEGSGAATALPLLRLACATHGKMATFAQAGVSSKS